MIPNFELDRKESGVFVLIPQRRRCRKKIPLDIDRHGGLLSRICLRRRLRMKRVLARSGSDGGCAKAGVKDLEAGDLTRKAMSGLSISGSGSPETSERSETGCGAAKENQVTEGEARGEKDSIGCNQFSHGSISVIGRRRKMEDAVTIAPGTVAGEFSFFAVYDGHGGAIVANACRDRLHTLLEEEIEIKKLKEPAAVGGGIEWEKVMAACFSKMDEEVCGSGSGETENAAEVSANSVGSTAVVVVVGKEEVVVANCGDSRAVLCRGGAAVPLSLDHKPDRPDERERVEAAGGRVINWNGYRVLGVLATSRSIGDNYLKPYVTSEPEVTVTRRIESDEFIIIATDGLWDVVSNETACDVVTK